MGILDRFKKYSGRPQRQSRVRWKASGTRKGRAAQKKSELAYIEDKHACPICHRHIDDKILKENMYVCPGCNHHFQLALKERISTIADPGTFKEFDSSIRSVDPIEFPGYKEKLDKARQKSGQNEAVTIGTCLIEGRATALGVMSFAFMGGSMGVAVGEKVTRLLLKGVEAKLPVVLFAASGGARMQEGIFSLMQMAKTSHAIALLQEQRLPFFVVLTHPTTGGVTASFAMLGNVILAEPGALIGFAGPRVIESTIKQKLPEGFQRSEFQQEKGFVDAVVDRKQLKSTLSFLIDTHVPRREVR
mgnify:CR=1 FL=1